MLTEMLGAGSRQDPDDVKRGHTIADLNTLYSDADSSDQQIFAEMRSNLLLVSGEHYQKKESNFFRRIRDSKELANEQKLRLTKNHIRKICQVYVNNIMGATPGVGFSAKNEKELHDQKVADLHHSVWRDAFEKYDIDDLMDDWCDNFVEIGEVSVKIFFDESRGEIKGYEPQMDPEGNPTLDMMGNMQPDTDKPVYMGAFVFEEIYGFNLLRPSECRDIKKAEWLGLRKMVGTDDLKLRFNDEQKIKFIQDSVDDTYQIFDAAYGGYAKANKKQVSVREYFFRPCLKYPKGYFYITTRAGILAEGELPGGIFPIVVQVFDKVQTTPRGRSPIKQMRPYQAEINRSASKMAEHQITLGDDKLLTQNGTKVSAGHALPGIRSVSYTGAVPTVLPGRSGAQYLEYMNSQITELYQVMSVAEDSEETPLNLDPYVLLYRSARQKKKFQRYIKRFEKFLIQIVKTYLALAKVHLDDEALVYAMGSQERVNIPEWKKMADICYEIKVEAQSDDIETKLGKQIVMNHALQYIGPQLKPEDIGKILRASPIADNEQAFDDLTIDYDNSVNDILALERGEQPIVGQYDNHVYQVKRLVSRMRQADFKYLPPQVQQNFEACKNAHEQVNAQQIEALQRAQSGFIPTSGYLVGMDFYVADPSDPSGKKLRRARIPQDSVTWLIKQLEAQGTVTDPMMDMNQGEQANLAQQVMGGGGGPGTMPGQMPRPQGGGNPLPPNSRMPQGGGASPLLSMHAGPATMGQGAMNVHQSAPGNGFHP